MSLMNRITKSTRVRRLPERTVERASNESEIVLPKLAT